MNNSYGELFRVTTFGESHGPAIGLVLDGVPAGLTLNLAAIQRELDRRRPGQSQISTRRNESDTVEILSGVFENVTTGTSLAMLIRNEDMRSRDYGNLAQIFRPGHADWGYFQKYGIRDYRGGGRSSGRETAARVAAGAVAKQLLADRHPVKIVGHVTAIGKVKAVNFDEAEIERNAVRTADAAAARAMIEEIIAAQADRDSVGGMVEIRISGVPAGWGEPVFDKLDAELAKAMLSIGGVKAIEFGAGFAVAERRGSENNDPMTGGNAFASNHAGGILGGISSGADIVFRIAVKPTPSIAQLQHTVDCQGNDVDVEIKGRHDPCLCPRAVVVAEAMSALVLADMMLRQAAQKY
ncbi:MAG: chorismate synthase [Victivallaceae bacterium]